MSLHKGVKYLVHAEGEAVSVTDRHHVSVMTDWCSTFLIDNRTKVTAWQRKKHTD